jgi:signal transduction histidine kinase
MAQQEMPENSLSWEFQGDLGRVMADENFMRLAILNIINNAIKYRRPEENPKVVIYTRPSTSAPDDRTVICLRDYGKGVARGEHRKIFQPFVRGSKEEQDTGFGLGLSLVSKVVGIMNGRVWAEPPKDDEPGTVFCIELPREVP